MRIPLQPDRALRAPRGQSIGTVAHEIARLRPRGIQREHAGHRIEPGEPFREGLGNREQRREGAEIEPRGDGPLQFHHQRASVGCAEADLAIEAPARLLPEPVRRLRAATGRGERLQRPRAPVEEGARAADVQQEARVVAGLVRQQHPTPRHHEVARRKLGTIAPSKPGPKMEGPRASILAACPRFRRSRDRLARRPIHLGQALEESPGGAHVVLVAEALRIQRKRLGGVRDHEVGAGRGSIQPQPTDQQCHKQQDGGQQAHRDRALRRVTSSPAPASSTPGPPASPDRAERPSRHGSR